MTYRSSDCYADYVLRLYVRCVHYVFGYAYIHARTITKFVRASFERSRRAIAVDAYATYYRNNCVLLLHFAFYPKSCAYKRMSWDIYSREKERNGGTVCLTNALRTLYICVTLTNSYGGNTHTRERRVPIFRESFKRLSEHLPRNSRILPGKRFHHEESPTCSMIIGVQFIISLF